MNPSTFRAAVVRTPGGPDSIEVVDVPVVAAGPGQVRVAVGAASINPVDLGVVRGQFHDMGLIDQPSYTGLGWDFAGTVIGVGPGVDLAVGTRVAGLIDGFDRDYGTYAEQLVVPAANVAVVPSGLSLVSAATVPLNALAAAQILDLLGPASVSRHRLLVTGAGGAVGGYLVPLAIEHGWSVTGHGRAEDEEFVRALGAQFTPEATPSWDAVVDAAVLGELALSVVRDYGSYIGVQPSAPPAEERGVTVQVIVTQPDGSRLADLLAMTASGRLSTRVHAVLSLDDVVEAHRTFAKGGIRGRFVIVP